MMFENILFETGGPIATLTINRPDKRNAINNATVEEVDQALAQVERDPELRVFILTGAGDKAFVAGADIHELNKRDIILGGSETRWRQEVYTRIEQLEIPSIAAINGWALGTGLELALACTLRVASSNASLGQPEVKLGITPGAGGTQWESRREAISRIGFARLRESYTFYGTIRRETSRRADDLSRYFSSFRLVVPALVLMMFRFLLKFRSFCSLRYCQPK
jgi:1,4-dihydroxy-2-naphthoyl-CoA synthase